MDLLYALLLSLLPPFYRRPFERFAGSYLIRGATISSLCEMLFAGIFFAKGFIEYTAKAYIPPAAFLEYSFTWQGLFCGFFFIDGAVRLLATIARQALGLLLFYPLAWLHGALLARSKRRRQPPLVRDVVEHKEGKDNELRISSCRPRKNWDKWMTVVYEEKLYEIAGAELGPDPRPFLYLLRIKPESKVIRGLHNYHPDEVFHLERE